MLKKFFSNPFIFFPLAAIVVLWPLSLCLFTVKNDALTYYYPVRALISDALNNGELPLWTPFINLGYPLHADMQSAAWSPVVWVFSFLTKYSLAGFHAELLFYFSLAGIGFYYLCRQYAFTITASLLFGLAYQFSGFMIDSVQFFSCISSACWLPFVFLFYKKMMEKKQMKNSLLLAFFLYLFFTGGYPSLFIVTGYLLAAHFIFSFFKAEEKKIFIKQTALQLAIAASAFILLSLPAIVSFIQLLPHIDRGSSQPISFVLENSMPPVSFFSFISPFATTATSHLLETDSLMRNVYIGLIPLLFVLYGIISKQVKIKGEAKFFLIASLVMFAMALGRFFFVREAAYYSLPLMNTFRHPAIIRLFGIFFLLLFGAYSFTQWQANNDTTGIKKLFRWFSVILLLFSIVMLLTNFSESLGLYLSMAVGETRNMLTSFGIPGRYFLQLPLILFLLLLIHFAFKSKRRNYFLLAVMAINIFAITQFNIPITIIGAAKFNQAEKEIGRNTAPFPLPSTTVSIAENSTNSYSKTTGSKLHLSKKIGRNDYYITPGNLAAQEKFYESSLKEETFKHPVVYFENDSTGNISINSFGTNYIELNATCHQSAKLIYLQNNYPGWEVFIDGKKSTIETALTTFMSVKLDTGKHNILFEYKPSSIYYCWYISLAALAALLFILCRSIFFKKHQ